MTGNVLQHRHFDLRQTINFAVEPIANGSGGGAGTIAGTMPRSSMFYFHAVVASQSIHLSNNPIISALANVLKCKLKPTTAADCETIRLSISGSTEGEKQSWLVMAAEFKR